MSKHVLLSAKQIVFLIRGHHASIWCEAPLVDFDWEEEEAAKTLEEWAENRCAAPEMLAALKAALDWHRGDQWRDSEQPQRRTAWAQQLERLEAAIRKAEEGK